MEYVYIFLFLGEKNKERNMWENALLSSFLRERQIRVFFSAWNYFSAKRTAVVVVEKALQSFRARARKRYILSVS